MSENPSQAPASSPEEPKPNSLSEAVILAITEDLPSEDCGDLPSSPSEYRECTLPFGHLGPHEYPPRLERGSEVQSERYWRCPRCSRSGRTPFMTQSRARIAAHVQHARLLHSSGDSCSCDNFTFSDTPEEETPKRSEISLFIGERRMCGRCTVFFHPTWSGAKFCEECEAHGLLGGTSKLPKDVVAAAAHLPAEIALSLPEEKEATLRIYTERIAALQKRCDLQARMHKEQVIVIQNLEQKLADLREVFKDTPEQGCLEPEDVSYPEGGAWFWVKWALFFAVLIVASLWIVGLIP